MADVPPERIRMLLPPPTPEPKPEPNKDRTLDGVHTCGRRFFLDLTCPTCHDALDGTSMDELLAYATAALQERVSELERKVKRLSNGR